MIKFFRHIRRDLMETGKTGKYLKYAIGEIVLVVIGILIALSINTWNGTKKEKKVEQMYLNNILRDLRDQNDSFDIQIENELSFYEAASYIIENYQENNTLVVDSTFVKLTSILTNRKTFVTNDPTFTDLISSGNINILKNLVYKDKLIKYYQELERIEKVIQSNNTELVDQHYITSFFKNAYFYWPVTEIEKSTLSELTDHIVIPEYSNELQEISKKIISKEENKMTILSAVYFRHSLAIGHIAMLKTIQTRTELLIAELERLSND